jgi:hypothetical protein
MDNEERLRRAVDVERTGRDFLTPVEIVAAIPDLLEQLPEEDQSRAIAASTGEVDEAPGDHDVVVFVVYDLAREENGL